MATYEQAMDAAERLLRRREQEKQAEAEKDASAFHRGRLGDAFYVPEGGLRPPKVQTERDAYLDAVWEAGRDLMALSSKLRTGERVTAPEPLTMEQVRRVVDSVVRRFLETS